MHLRLLTTAMSRLIAAQRMFKPVQASLGVGLARDLTSMSRLSGARRASSSMPLLLQKSFWKQMVPKPFRKSTDSTAPKRVKSKDWNPATFFICIFLLIGSMSIQQIALKKSFETFMRQSDVRIGLLREVVEKLQKGEEVDVEKVLGTGDPEKEFEWQEVIDEIEREDIAHKKKQAERAAVPKVEPKIEQVRIQGTHQTVEQTPSSSRASFF